MAGSQPVYIDKQHQDDGTQPAYIEERNEDDETPKTVFCHHPSTSSFFSAVRSKCPACTALWQQILPRGNSNSGHSNTESHIAEWCEAVFDGLPLICCVVATMDLSSLDTRPLEEGWHNRIMSLYFSQTVLAIRLRQRLSGEPDTSDLSSHHLFLDSHGTSA